MALIKQVGDRLTAKTLQVSAHMRGTALTVAREQHENLLSVGLQAGSANGGSIFIGDANVQPWELKAGQQLVLDISRMSEVYWFGNTAGDVLNVIGVLTTGEAVDSYGA